jgi:hypothetical protein
MKACDLTGLIDDSDLPCRRDIGHGPAHPTHHFLPRTTLKFGSNAEGLLTSCINR